MQIVLFCATQRGLLFLQQLHKLAPEHEIIVFSFREEPHEPPFFDAIQNTANAIGAQFHEARQVSTPQWTQFWDNLSPDLIFAVSWRYMIPPSVYQRATIGAYVFHDSLLPAYRGFSPTVWAIINGEDHTGATLFEMAEDVDSGAIIAQQRIAIGIEDTIADILPRVTDAYLQILTDALPALIAKNQPRTPQDHTQATYTCRRTPADNAIDWTQPTRNIYNLIRALTAPYPGAYTTLNGEPLIIWGAKRLPDYPRYVGRVCGRIIEICPNEGVVVLTGDGALLLTDVQLADAPRQNAAQILNKLSYTLGH